MQAVTAACMLVNAADFCDVGGFDTAYWNGTAKMWTCVSSWRNSAGKLSTSLPVWLYEGKSGHERTVAITINNARLRGRWEGLVAPDIIDVEGSITPAEGLAHRIQVEVTSPQTPHMEIA